MRKVVGIHSCLETLKVRPKKIQKVFLKKDYNSNPKLSEVHRVCIQHKIYFEVVSIQSLDRICEGHQGVALDVSETPEMNWDKIEKKEDCLILALDGLEDPQNLGNILRTAWLMGVDGILMTQNRSVGLTPSVCKVASGGTEHVPVEFVNQLIDPIKLLKKQGFWVYGLSEKSEKIIWKEDLHPKSVLVAGSEMKGMKPQTFKECDVQVCVPQIEASSSLNVATSLAISVAEWLRKFRY